MLRLLKFELYKIFSRKSILITMLVFLLMLVFAGYGSAQYFIEKHGDPESFYNDFYKGKEGTVTPALLKETDDFFAPFESLGCDDYLDMQNEIKEKIGERKFNGLNYYYKDAENAARFAKEIEDNREEVDANLKLRADTLGKESYDYKYAKLHSEIVTDHKYTDLYFDPMWNEADSNQVYLIVAALILLGITPIFATEYSNKTDSLLLTSKKGKGSTITAKILASVIYSAAVALIYCVANILTFGYVLGFRGFDKVPQYGFGHADQVLLITNFEQFALKTAFMMFGAILFAMLVLLLSSIFKNQLVTFFISGFVFILPQAYQSLENRMQFAENVKHFFKALFYFSYDTIFQTDKLFNQFKAYNIFGNPVICYVVVPAVFIIITAVFIALIYPIFKKHQVY